MVYFCADDYGLTDKSSERIIECVNNGILNKISIFPNFNVPDINSLPLKNEVSFSVHINLVEGKCLSTHKKNILADENGNFLYTFNGLFMLSLLKKKEFEACVYEEIKAQVLSVKKLLPEGMPLMIDSHQHTHMIPSVFKALMKVTEDEKISVKYLRIPAEPLMPYLKVPSLYFTYSPVNLIKQWLLKILWQINKKEFKNKKSEAAYFFGILFSGKMDKSRVEKVLPHYIKLAEKKGKDIEVLFHPGYLKEDEKAPGENIVFQKFYYSPGRKIEFDAVTNLSI